MSAASKLPFPILFLLALAPAQEQAVAQKAEKPAPVVVTTSFRGGSMAEFVATLRAAEPKANIVVATAATTARVPAIELRGAGIEQALEGACAVAEAEMPVRVIEFRGGGEPVYSIVAVTHQGVGPGTATTAMTAPAPKPDDTTQVFSLNRLTDPVPLLPNSVSFKVETILSAIEAGTADDSRKAVLRYHRDSGLLFLRGTRLQTNLVKDLLSNLERDLDERRRRDPLGTATQPAVDKDGAKKD